MPIYEYQCSECNKVTEDFTTISENKKELKCECGSPAKRIISGSTFVIHGYSEANGYASKET